MTKSNLGSVVLILFIFSLIHLFLTMSIGIANIKNNWDDYKCNPGIIPFAGVFGHDPVTTANECVKTTQMNFMSSFLEPIYASIGFLAENGSFFNEIFKNMKLFGNGIQDLNMDFFDNIIIWFTRLSGNLNLTIVSIFDIFRNLDYLFLTLNYTFKHFGEMISNSSQELPGTIWKVIMQ